MRQSLVQETECSRFVCDDLLRVRPTDLARKQIVVDGERILECVEDQRTTSEELEPVHRRLLVDEKIWPDYVDACNMVHQMHRLQQKVSACLTVIRGSSSVRKRGPKRECVCTLCTQYRRQCSSSRRDHVKVFYVVRKLVRCSSCLR